MNSASLSKNKTTENYLINPHEIMLGEALHRVLIKAGVLSRDSTPTGAELVLADNSFTESLYIKGAKP